MRRINRGGAIAICAAGILAALLSPASAIGINIQPNFWDLLFPGQSQSSRPIWTGSGFGYTHNGLAFNYHATRHDNEKLTSFEALLRFHLTKLGTSANLSHYWGSYHDHSNGFITTTAGGIGLLIGEVDRAAIFGVGIPLQARVTWAPLDYLGLSLTGLVNINTTSPFAAILIGVEGGRIRHSAAEPPVTIEIQPSF